VLAEVADLRSHHRQEPEGEQDRALGPLVDHHVVGSRVDVGDAGLARVELVHRRHDLGPGGGIGRAQLGPPLPQVVDGRR
jgi:hypothetical protein